MKHACKKIFENYDRKVESYESEHMNSVQNAHAFPVSAWLFYIFFLIQPPKNIAFDFVAYFKEHVAQT